MLKAENLVPKGRLIVVNGVITLLMLILLGRFFQIQIYRYEKYKYKADVNRIRAVTIHAPRGLILDRNNEILVDNYPTYVLSAVPGEMGKIEDKIKIVNSCTGIDSSIIASNYQKYYRSPFSPVRLAKDLTFRQVSILEEHKLDLAGIRYEQFPERYYPSKIRGSHLLGYVKEVDRTIRGKLTDQRHYEHGDLIGWQGLEKTYETYLRGTKGVNYFVVDAFGREVGKVENQEGRPPIPGNDLLLTIDADFQYLMESEMNGYRGATIVSDPESGDVLAYVSVPDYAPNLFTGATLPDKWNQILNDPNKPLMDRIINGLYPPGSTFKMVTILALLENNLIDPARKIVCTGSYEFGDRIFRCWKETGHGEVNMQKAVAQSCNIYFYQAVQKLTLDQWAKACYDFGFSQPTGIDLPFEKSGVVPTSSYMNKKYGKWGWSRGVLLNLALGQGDVLVTPIQMLNFVNNLATHGKAKRLHFVLGKAPNSPNKPSYSSNTWRLIDTYLKATISDAQGTGRAADPMIKGLTVAGKTGTAENPHGEPHAWFIGYGKMESKILSVVVLVENGGHGGEVAAPIARKAFEYYFGGLRKNEPKITDIHDGNRDDI